MIERFSIASPKGLIKKLTGLKAPTEYKPIYNASVKSGKIPVITSDNQYRFELMSWGLMPFESEDPLIATKLTNARFETLEGKQPYCDMLATKRCVVLMDGYYVWKELNNVRTPYRVTLNDGGPFAVAALWDGWQKAEGGEFFKTFSIITVPANELSNSYNDRMPAILTERERIVWLDDTKAPSEVLPLIKTFDKDFMNIYRVSNLVDQKEVNTSRVIKELNAPSPGDTLSLFD